MIPAGLAIKLGAMGLALAFAFGSGCSMQKRHDAGSIAAKDSLIQAAAISNKVMGDAIRDINAEAAKREADAAKQAADSRAAEKIAVEANAASAKRADLFADRLAKAGKSKPDCASLLALDLEKVCGVKSR